MSTQLQLVSTIITAMSTLEISELTGTRHDNVMSVANRLAEKGIIRSPKIKDFERINNLGFPVKQAIYSLNKIESLNLVARLSPEFMAKVIDRWQELEAQPNNAYNDLLGKYVALLDKHVVLQDRFISLPKPNVLKTGRYSYDEDQIIHTKRLQGCGARTIAKFLNRTEDSVKGRFRYLKTPQSEDVEGSNADIFRAEDWQKDGV